MVRQTSRKDSDNDMPDLHETYIQPIFSKPPETTIKKQAYLSTQTHFVDSMAVSLCQCLFNRKVA